MDCNGENKVTGQRERGGCPLWASDLELITFSKDTNSMFCFPIGIVSALLQLELRLGNRREPKGTIE